MSWAGAHQIDIAQYRRRTGDRAALGACVNDGRSPATAALICFSHLRWHFVYQRPQHLMTRFARDHDITLR